MNSIDNIESNEIREIENKLTDITVKKKRGRKRKNENVLIEENKNRNKYFIDLTKDLESKELINNLINQANKKDFGRKIDLKDLIIFALPKLNIKDLERIQENTLSPIDKLRRAHVDYNQKNQIQLSFNEFLIKKTGISWVEFSNTTFIPIF